MRAPHLTVEVNESPELVICKVSDQGTRAVARHPLAELDAYDIDKASSLIGKAIIGLLAHAHRDIFEPFRNLKYERDFEDQLHLITALISRSVSKRTKMHIPTIEAVIADIIAVAPDMGQARAIIDWPIIKARIEGFPD